MAPTVQQIVKRLTAIEGRIETRAPVVRWLDVYKSEADIEATKGRGKSGGGSTSAPAHSALLAEADMNAVKLEQRISELEARREAQSEREFQAFLQSLSDEQLQLMIDGLRAVIRSEPVNVAAAALITRSPGFPAHRRRELTPEEQAQIDAFVRGDLVVGASGHFVVAAGGPQEGKGHELNGSNEAA